MRSDDAQSGLSASAERLVKLASDELGEMSARSRAEGFLKLNARRSAGMRSGRRFLVIPAVLAVAAVVLVGRHWLSSPGSAALSYAIESGRIDSTGAVEATGKADPRLRFSDGTEVVFLAGARGRVKSVSEHGARIALSGKADVAVVPGRGSHWLFDAGPFLIKVTGTAFTADWREAEGRLEVALRTGTISVASPLSDEAIALRAGQRLIASTREKAVVIRSIDSASDAGVAVSDQPTAPVAQRPPASSAPAAPSAQGTVATNWATELAAGHFSTILRQAEERGVDTVIAEVSSHELAALSDAARYSRRDDVARRALVAQRRRFPGSARANDAAFLLGRLEETAQHLELALGWYERYLNESPNGTYTSEALGRKMTVVQRLHGTARARPVAEEYLRRFGNGTYAAAARGLERAP